MAEQDETTLGNVLTPEEYQARNIDFYAAPQIQVEAAPEVDEPEDDDEPVRPDILTPVGQRGEQVANVFGQIPLYGTGEQFGTEDYNSYIENFDKQQASDLSGKSFNRYLEQAAGVPGAVATVATGLPISAMAYGAGQLARKEHRKNAAAIQAISGASGDMFKFNGQTVSRAPGSKIFTGNLGGLSQADMFRSREIAKGFVPGTMAIGKGFGSLDAARTGGDAPETGLSGVTSIEGAMMDAFGTVHTGQRDESGHMMASATQAQRLREQEFRDMARQKGIDISGLKGANFVNAAVEYKQMVDAQMKGQSYYGGFFHKTSNMSISQNNQALDDRRTFGGTAFDSIASKYGITTTPTTSDDGGTAPSSAPASASAAATSDDGYPTTSGGSDISGGTTPGFGPGGGGPGPRSSDRENRESDIRGGGGPPGGGGSLGYGSTYSSGNSRSARDMDMRASGGRIGMQAGGVAQQPQPAGFVGGPPENFTDGQTVADDQPMSVPEGTFVINAAAVEFAGSDDIKTMLSKAYGKMQKKVDKTIGVAKIPTEDEIDVAVSRGEVIVPPEVAKIIGYDRLEKINNRGKKEVSRRQEAAGGGFLDGKKDGGEVTRPTPKPSLVERRKDEALADVELRADLEAYIKEDKLARLGWDLYSKGEIDMTGVMLRNPKTGKDYGSSNYSGFYFPKKGQEMYPGPVEVAKADTDQTVMPRLGAMQSGKSIRTDIPSIYYYAEKNPALRIRKDKDGNIINTPQEMSRAGVFLTMAHELRHAALNYIHNEGGVKNVIGTPRAEERLMDYYDYHNRRIAAASDSSVPKTDPVSGGRQEFASYDHMQRELNEYYENIAAAALKGRKVPPRAKSIKKNFFERFINELFD